MSPVKGASVTRADVARLAGVSTAVVSYVLNDGPRPVSANARAAVERAVRELRYRPNVAARTLKGGSSGSVGLLLPNQTNPYYAELAEAVEREFAELGVLVLVGVVGHVSGLVERYVENFSDRRVDGILAIGGESLEERIRSANTDVPLAFLDRKRPDGNSLSVTTDRRGGAIRAIEHLQAHGHEVIGCVSGPAGFSSSSERIEGWREQMLKGAYPPIDSLIAHGDFTPRGGENAAMALLKKRSDLESEFRPAADGDLRVLRLPSPRRSLRSRAFGGSNPRRSGDRIL